MNKWIVLLIIIIFFTLPLSKEFISYTVTGINNAYHSFDSLANEQDFSIDIPGGNHAKELDWYPFMSTYNAHENYSFYTGEDLELTVLYNFGSFISGKGRSRIYDGNSEYYSSYYGAYLVKDLDLENGLYLYNDDGSINLEELNDLIYYDYVVLVLKGLGAGVTDIVFDVEIDKIGQVELHGEEWIRLDADFIASGVAHRKTDFRLMYLQLGNPKEHTGIDFEAIELHGRLFIRYYEDGNTTVCMYVISPSLDLIDETEKELLRDTK